MNDIITIDTSINPKRYEPYSLVADDNPILKQITKTFDFSSNDIDEISGRMIETLRQNKGFGLAAPQCGLDMRVFIMGTDPEYSVIVNPEILSYSSETECSKEGCLSFPFLMLSITRPTSISVRFYNEKEELVETMLTGLSARVFQHEYDHVMGITFNTRAKPIALQNGMKKKEKFIKQYARQIIAAKTRKK